MATRLVQQQFLKGKQEFEIFDEVVNVRLKTLFKEKEKSVSLLIIDPEPLIEEPYLHFRDSVRRDPVLTLHLNKPNPSEFNAFVDELRRRVMANNAFRGQTSASIQPPLGGNSLDQPPEDVEPQQIRVARIQTKINVERVDGDIQMLRQYVKEPEVEPLITALEALKADPQSEANQVRVVEVFNGLGLWQGSVLTYAPYVGILLSDDVLGLFETDRPGGRQV
jgi:hypothetical protein